MDPHPRVLYEKVKEYETDPSFGITPQERSIPELLDLGIINIDKPANPTSHEVTAWVKQILGLKKAGHGGTLDPSVTGCLPVALERATRALQVLLLSGKEYICVLKTHEPISKIQLATVIDDFRGKIYQTPPLRSNVKRRLRVRQIYELDFIENDPSNQLWLLRVKCEAGTYIRKLCYDVGLVLGTGAHMAELRRTQTGVFTETTCVTLDDLRDAWYYYKMEGDETLIRKFVQPAEILCSSLPKLFIRDSAVDAICHGAALTLPGVVRVTNGISDKTMIAIMTMKGELVAFAQGTMSTKEILNGSTGICARPRTVFMRPYSYPSLWGRARNIVL
ncbi:MAG: RNA-guided pseudouridylation complex pseudouridine synthase subunit Cbf5 [Candidatus Heimdallarchaeota archaeon]